jgi:nucleotide-binding universal stress UspA family protein
MTMSSTQIAPQAFTHAPAGTRPGPLVAAVSENGGHVLRTAAALAPVFGDRVHVYWAIEPLPGEMVAGEPVAILPALEERRRESRIERLGAQIAEVVREGHGWQLEVEHGDPVTSLVQHARAVDAALIVMGLRRHHAVDRLLAGDMTLRVVRRAHCPVLAVAGELERRPRTVVVGTDFSPQSLHAAEVVLPLLAEDAVVHVVHVWQPTASTDPTVYDVEEEYARALVPRMAHFVAALHAPAGVTVRSELREGRCAPQLLAAAEEHHADLIVAGRQSLSAIARFFVGSVTSALLRAATTSVLVTTGPTPVEHGPDQTRATRSPGV